MSLARMTLIGAMISVCYFGKAFATEYSLTVYFADRKMVVDAIGLRNPALEQAMHAYNAYVGTSTGLGTPVAILFLPLFMALSDWAIGF